MSYIFLQYPKCSTCKKAQNWLNWNKISYESRHIVDETPSIDELTTWIEKSGLPVEKFFNSNGIVYKNMGLKDKLPEMSKEEKIDLLSTNGMLIKRPIFVSDNLVLIGFKEADWKKILEL